MMISLWLFVLAMLPLVVARQLPGPTKRYDLEDELDDLDPPFHALRVPVDHFHNESIYEPHTDAMFDLRYAFNPEFYKPGGPVMICYGGEAAIDDRAIYLWKPNAIVNRLAEATNGMAVLLEHRYYGRSLPVKSFDNENLRFLTTQQTLADQAYFHRNVVFPAYEQHNLTAHTTPYIAYGCSYGGGLAAFMRKLYPGITWAAVSSSGLTESIWDYWEFWDTPRRLADDRKCIETQQKLINVFDNIISRGAPELTDELMAMFGLTERHSLPELGIKGINTWPNKNKDDDFIEYCSNITSGDVAVPAPSWMLSKVKSLIASGGWGNESDTLTTSLLNLIGWEGGGMGKRDLDANDAWDDKTAWLWQKCTEWGLFQTGNVPEEQLPVVTRAMDINFRSAECQKRFQRSSAANVSAVNQYGGIEISYPRLALVVGEHDPFRTATPLAVDKPSRFGQESTDIEPVIIIKNGDHCDERFLDWFAHNSRAANETATKIIDAVRRWHLEWKMETLRYGGTPPGY